MNKLNLNCVLHGDYQKLKDDQDKVCPHCLKQKVITKKEAGIKPIKSSFDLFTAVTVKCEVHGDTVLNVPKMVASSALHCPACIGDKRSEKLKKHIDRFINASMAESGIPANSLGMTFKNVDRTRSEKQTKIIERLVIYVREMMLNGQSIGSKNILFSGNMGTGKTLFASLLLQNIARRSLGESIQDKHDIYLKGGYAFTFISEQMLIGAITASWADKTAESTSALISRLSGKAILCIDDVGTVTTAQTHLLDAYSAIIDERYKRKLPTIMTSNMTHEGIKLAIGSRAADRFFETDKVIVANFDWNGYRVADDSGSGMEIF